MLSGVAMKILLTQLQYEIIINNMYLLYNI